MSNKILKTTFALGTLAVLSAGIASILSKEENRKKVKETAEDLTNKANMFAKELEQDYRELDKNLSSYTKTKEYKEKIDEVSKASREILKQLDILRSNSKDLLIALRQQAQKSVD